MTYSDWEAEASEAPYLSDALALPPPTRTDTELNLAVLRRHNAAVVGLVHVAPYAVVYEFSAAQQAWEKAGIEGSAFVVQLAPSATHAARFAVVVLNRRGLHNFELELHAPDEVEVTDEYIILQRKPPGAAAPHIFGLWVFAEPPPASTATQREQVARCVLECAERVEAGRRLPPAEQLPQLDGAQDDSPPAASDRYASDMARQGSLTALLEQQRHADDSWSVRSHSPSYPTGPPQHHLPQHQHPPPAAAVPSFAPSADTDFFLSTRPAGTGTRTTPSPAVSAQGSLSGAGHKENLLDLFKRAGDSYRGAVV